MNNLNINITSLSFKCSREEGDCFITKFYNKQSVEILGGKYLIIGLEISHEACTMREEVSIELELFKVEDTNE